MRKLTIGDVIRSKETGTVVVVTGREYRGKLGWCWLTRVKSVKTDRPTFRKVGDESYIVDREGDRWARVWEFATFEGEEP